MASPTHSPEPKSASSPSTALTTPEQPATHDADSDIWESDGPDDNDDDDGTISASVSRPSRPAALLSDLPTVRRQHMTDGYREGLAVGKARVMQRGFDAGYPVGMAVAVRVGRVLGVLEGCLAATSAVKAEGVERDREEVRKLLEGARGELACAALLSGVTDEVVAEADGVPAAVEGVLAKWERVVLGRVGVGSGGSG